MGVLVYKAFCSITWGSRSSSGCSGIQGIFAQLTGGYACLLYKCIVLDLAVGVAVYKASMLNCWRDPSAFYIYALYWYLVVGIVVCKASVLNWLKGLDLAMDVVVCKTSMLNWWGSICLLYKCIVLDLALGVEVCKASMLNWWESICLLYICVLLYLAFGVEVCKVSVLNWLGV